MINFFSKISSSFSFIRCPVCGGPKRGSFLCDGCLRSLEKVKDRYCIMCGEPLGDQSPFCVECILHPRMWDYFFFYGYYRGPLKQIIIRFKYFGEFNLLGVLQRILCNGFFENECDFYPDVIVPVPIHRDRLRKRGFNQSLEIAKGLARVLDVPLKRKMLLRIKNTLPQVGLSRTSRQDNVKGAFQLNEDIGEDIGGSKILLVDDVFTSGATVLECVKCLKKGGATSVGVALVARALFKRE